MMIALNGDRMHIEQSLCAPTLDGIQIDAAFGVSPGRSDFTIALVLSIDEAILLAATVEDILAKIRDAEQAAPICYGDALGEIAARAKQEAGE